MPVEPFSLSDIASILNAPHREDALRSLDTKDPPFPILTARLHRMPLPAGRVLPRALPSERRTVHFETITDDGDVRRQTCSLGAYLLLALNALIEEQGGLAQAAPLFAQATRLFQTEQGIRIGGRELGEEGSADGLISLITKTVREMHTCGLKVTPVAVRHHRATNDINPETTTGVPSMADRTTTPPEQAARDLEWLRQAGAHAASPGTAPAPDLRLLADDPLRPDLKGDGAIKQATAGRDPRNGSPVVLMSLADTRDGPLKGGLRRPRALAPPVAAAFRVVLWFGHHPDATGRLTADPQSAWLITGGGFVDFGREQAMASALAVYDLNHDAAGLDVTREAYRSVLSVALDAAAVHFASLPRRDTGEHRKAA